MRGGFFLQGTLLFHLHRNHWWRQRQSVMQGNSTETALKTCVVKPNAIPVFWRGEGGESTRGSMANSAWGESMTSTYVHDHYSTSNTILQTYIHLSGKLWQKANAAQITIWPGWALSWTTLIRALLVQVWWRYQYNVYAFKAFVVNIFQSAKL